MISNFIVKHAIGLLWAILTIWGVGFIYMVAADPGAVWWDQGVLGVACLVGAIVLFRIWNRAMGDIPWWPRWVTRFIRHWIP
jgi:hypothetical protein